MLLYESKEIAKEILSGNGFRYKDIKYINIGNSRCDYDPNQPQDTIIYLNKEAYKNPYESAVVGAHEAAHALNNISNQKHIKDFKKNYKAYKNSLLISFISIVILPTLLLLKTNTFVILLILGLKLFWYVFATIRFNKPYQHIYNKDELDAEITAKNELIIHVINNSLKFPKLTKEDKFKLVEVMEKRVEYAKKPKNKVWEHFFIAGIEIILIIFIIYILRT